MQIPAPLAAFVAGPVLMTLATRDSANRPMIARGLGVRPEGPDRLRVGFCVRLWPETAANLLDNGWLALVVVDPVSYRTFQFKGRARLLPPSAGDAAFAAEYGARTLAGLGENGMPSAQIAHWLRAEELAVAELAVERMFEQTPGPRAGAVVT